MLRLEKLYLKMLRKKVKADYEPYQKLLKKTQKGGEL